MKKLFILLFLSSGLLTCCAMADFSTRLLPSYSLYEISQVVPGALDNGGGVVALPAGMGTVPFENYKGPASFVCRVPVKPSYLTSCFGDLRSWGRHHGIDYGAAVGTPVITPMGGKVVYAGFSPVGYGNLVVIENQGYQIYLAHNSKIMVFVGQIVQAGDLVAYSGNTGNSTGPHLHFEIRKVGPKQAESLDPSTVILPGQISFCDWYHQVPASEMETHGCEKQH